MEFLKNLDSDLKSALKTQLRDLWTHTIIIKLVTRHYSLVNDLDILVLLYQDIDKDECYIHENCYHLRCPTAVH